MRERKEITVVNSSIDTVWVLLWSVDSFEGKPLEVCIGILFALLEF